MLLLLLLRRAAETRVGLEGRTTALLHWRALHRRTLLGLHLHRLLRVLLLLLRRLHAHPRPSLLLLLLRLESESRHLMQRGLLARGGSKHGLEGLEEWRGLGRAAGMRLQVGLA